MEQNLKLYVAIYLYCNNKNSKKKTLYIYNYNKTLWSTN